MSVCYRCDTQLALCACPEPSVSPWQEVVRLRAEVERLQALLRRSRDLFHWARIHSDLVDDIDAALAAGGE